MKSISTLLFLSALFFTNTASALPILDTMSSCDTCATFLNTSYSYDASTDIFTIDMSESISSVYYDFNGVRTEVFNPRATFSAIIDDTGHVSSGSMTWYGSVPSVPGLNYGGDKIAEATVTSASYGFYDSGAGPGIQFGFNISNSGIDLGDSGNLNLYGTWPGIIGGATPWDSSYSDVGYYETDLNIRHVPEPSSLALLGLGLIGVYAKRRTKRIS